MENMFQEEEEEVVSRRFLASAPLRAVQIGAGARHSCALLEDRNSSVVCWGDNSQGQLGNGVFNGPAAPQTPISFDTLEKPVALASGDFHNCVIVKDKTVWCWGDNSQGQLGIGNQQRKNRPNQVKFKDGQPLFANSISLGASHSCAVSNDSLSIFCFGSNQFGQAGLALNTRLESTNSPPSSSPSSGVLLNPTGSGVVMPNGLKIEQISAGGAHTCVKLSDGIVHCFGNNSNGQLGDGVLTSRFALGDSIKISNGSPLKAAFISAGRLHSCVVVQSSDEVFCFGDNDDNELGLLSDTEISRPTTAVAFTDSERVKSKAVSSGAAYTCLIKTDNTLRCFGKKSNGILADGENADTGGSLPRTEPVKYANTKRNVNVAKLASGTNHACAIVQGSNNVVCWGSNVNGQVNGVPNAPVIQSPPSDQELAFDLPVSYPLPQGIQIFLGIFIPLLILFILGLLYIARKRRAKPAAANTGAKKPSPFTLLKAKLKFGRKKNNDPSAMSSYNQMNA